ncbi:hypothetical protein QNA24_29805 [Rhodococcus qingshengii]|nr:hypothetical protein [Rhodococcus qingshengii]MDJ0490579.1 hypothetical protein [Rhodococcus qingshengii]
MPASKSGERFGSFTEFVECPQPYGLGMAVDDFKKLLEVKTHEELKFKGGTKTAKHFADMRANVRTLLAEDVPALGVNGGDRRSETARLGSVQQSGATRLNDSAENNANYITARLKRDDPEMAEKVIAGEITPNAAAREKGWRKPRILVSSPAATASALVRHLNREQVAELICHLQAELEGPEQ